MLYARKLIDNSLYLLQKTVKCSAVSVTIFQRNHKTFSLSGCLLRR